MLPGMGKEAEAATRNPRRSGGPFALAHLAPERHAREALGLNDPLAKSHLSAFPQALAELGWTDGRNVRMELR
jgi:hypothetical protein